MNGFGWGLPMPVHLIIFLLNACFIWLFYKCDLWRHLTPAPVVTPFPASYSVLLLTPTSFCPCANSLSSSLTFLVSLVQYCPSLILLFSTPFSPLWERFHMAGLPNSVPVNPYIQKKSSKFRWVWFPFHTSTPTNACASIQWSLRNTPTNL